MMGDRGWFADWDNEATTDYGWQPCLETGIGHIPCFEVWFKTRAECEQWIAENVIGVEWLPGEPTAIPAALVAPSRVPGEESCHCDRTESALVQCPLHRVPGEES